MYIRISNMGYAYIFFLLEFLCWYSRQIHICLSINNRMWKSHILGINSVYFFRQSVLLVHTFFWFKAVNAKPCIVDGVEYKDGAQFQLDCRRTCTCQNGNYGCADLCPQEHIPPSDRFCKNAKLVNVSGTCCKEWSCELSNLTNNKSPRHAMLKSANLVLMSEGKPIWPVDIVE